ncbi:MAG: D-alanyl-D-alanine carboxypeptidase [Clostridia bacterium]|nr:D-alanyl-D-alanine carboxypeptidase [Clostridia bacterium]
MSKKQVVSIMIVITFLSIFSCMAFSSTVYSVPKIDGASAVLLEAERGQILFKKNETQRLHISSASKVMTALIVLEKIKLDTKVTISKEAAGVKGSILSLEAGEKFYAEDLINTIMLTSANDAATALAEHVSGDSFKFADAMNAKAQELKMKDTKFVNPTGLYDAAQYTTAQDLAKLMQYALKNPNFNRIFGNKGQPFNSKILTSSNKLLWSYPGVDGGKAGYNEKNKQTAITSATRNQQRLIAIVLDSPEEKVWMDSANLLNYGFDNFITSSLAGREQVLRRVSVGDKTIGLTSLNDILYVHPKGESFIRSVEFKVPQDLKPPIGKSNPVGKVTYVLMDGNVIDIPLYSDTEIQLEKGFLSNLFEKLKETRDLLIAVIVLILIEVLLIVRKFYRFMKNRVHKN